MDRTALDRPWSDKRDFDHEVVEGLGSKSWKRRHLGAGLDLEDAHRVGPRQHRVDLWFLGNRGEVDDLHRSRREIDHVVECFEHAKTE